MSTMKNPVSYFEIPVNDLACAEAFYTHVFDSEFERTHVDGNDMAMFSFDSQWAGATGALVQGESYVPSKAGARLYFNTTNIDNTLQKVIAVGGKVLYPKTSIGEYGWVAEFEDSEGNCIALHEE